MIPSKTHNYQAPCGRNIHIVDTKEEILIDIDKGGTCRSILLQVIAQFINAVSRDKAIEILSGSWDKSGKAEDRGYTCDKGCAGNKSCPDRLAKYLKEGK